MSLLVSEPNTPICAGCLAKRLGVTHKTAHEATIRLEARPGFARRYGRCADCRKNRIVTARHIPYDPREVEPSC